MPDEEDADIEEIRARGSEGWPVYRKLILAELKRLSGKVESLGTKIDAFRQDDISQIKTEIAVLKVKSAFIGAVAGALLSLIVTVLGYYFTHK